MAITHIGSVASLTTSANITAHQAGDLIIVWAFNSTSTTTPALPAGWTSIITRAGTTCSMRVGYRIATASGTTSGTWSNATRVITQVYRSNVPGGSLSVATTSAVVSSGSTNAVTIPAIASVPANSWVVAFAGHRTSASFAAPSGQTYTSRVTSPSGNPLVRAYDTNTVVTSTTAASVPASLSSGWISGAVPITETAPTPPALLAVKQSVDVGAGGGWTSLTATFPSAPTSGNLLTAVVTADKSVGSFNTPTGWAELGPPYVATSVSQAVYYRIADGSAADSSVTATWATNQPGILSLIEWDAKAMGAPVVAVSSSEPDIKSLTANPGAASADGFALGFLSIDSAIGTPWYPSWSNGYYIFKAYDSFASSVGLQAHSVAGRDLLAGESSSVTTTPPETDAQTLKVATFVRGTAPTGEARAEAPADVAGATDAASTTMARPSGLADSAGATDATSAASERPRAVADAAGATDAAAATVARASTVTDAAGASDVADAVLSRGTSASVVDTAGAADAVSAALARSAVLGDTAGVADVVARDRAAAPGLSDQLGVADSAVAELRRVYDVELQDEAGATDSASGVLSRSYEAAIDDTASVEDETASSLARGYAGAPQDTAGVSDATSAALSRVATPTDTASASDAASGAASRPSGPADAAAATDDVSAVLVRVYDVTVVDGATIADDVRLTSARVLTVVDGATISDDTSVDRFGRGVADLQESVVATDDAMAVLTRSTGAAVTDTAPLADDVETTLLRPVGLQEPVGITDALEVEIVRRYDVLLEDALPLADTVVDLAARVYDVLLEDAALVVDEAAIRITDTPPGKIEAWIEDTVWAASLTMGVWSAELAPITMSLQDRIRAELEINVWKAELE